MGQHPRDAEKHDGGPSSPMTQADLEKVRDRDPQALGQLFDACFGRVYGLAFRLTGQEAAAQDITQEVFIRVYNAAHQLDPERDPVPWLLTITANLCRENWRSRAGRQEKLTLSLDAEPEYMSGVAAPEATPEEVAILSDRKGMLIQALDQLPEPMRLVVVLHDMQGLTHEEIGTLLEETAPAVRKRYSRALVKLRELLQDHGLDVLE